MPPVAKRRLTEIIALYELEPSLKDIYVEGENDARILSWFLRKNGQHDVRVYTIQVVEMPPSLFHPHGLNASCTRDHVVLLSEELSERLRDARKRLRCIADADFDRHLGRCRKNDILEYTDYTSVEVYLFNQETMGKFIHFAFHQSQVSVSELMRNLGQVLQRVFLFRLANEKLGWGMTWIDLKDYLSYGNGRIEFDERRFVKNYLVKNAKGGDGDTFQKAVEESSTELAPDVRQNIRGHDFTYLLFLMGRKCGGKRFTVKNWETFEALFCGFVEFEQITREPLFVSIGRL
jgi:hypothetical protein